MRSLSAALVALMIGCSSSSPSDDPARAEAGTDSAAPDVAFVVDTAIDSAACPPAFPGEAAACTATTSCTFADTLCGGTFTGTCVSGAWKTTPNGQCGPYCPQSRPDPGASCADYKSGRQCSYWPVSETACESCTCTDGKWVCGATCTMAHADCRSDTACTENTGCGRGRCNNYCACGVDGKLHCTSTLC